MKKQLNKIAKHMHKCASSKTKLETERKSTVYQAGEWTKNDESEWTYALMWFDGSCVKMHGFCYWILFPSSFYNVRPSASNLFLSLCLWYQIFNSIYSDKENKRKNNHGFEYMNAKRIKTM